VTAHDIISRRGALRAAFAAAALAGALLAPLFTGSCGRSSGGDRLVLKEDVYGFFLGQTKGVVFRRARGIANITKAPEPPLGFRGELYDFSAPLEVHRDVSSVRCAFFDGRLLEVIVYFRDTSPQNLERLKLQLEGQFRGTMVAEDSRREMAQKTYRLRGPGMSITLRRITKKEGIELYIQYLHDDLHRELLERGGAAG
jgi:hypothetical protein